MNPYTRLKNEAATWIQNAVHPHRVPSFTVKSLDGLTIAVRERIIAADQLGYRMESTVSDGGTITFTMVKKLPSEPWWVS